MFLSFLSRTDHWILAGILFFIFAFFAVINFIYFHGKVSRGFDVGPSYAPFIGGFLGVIGVMAMPVGELTDRLVWLWVPLSLDTSCLPTVVIGLYFRFRDRAKK